MAGKVEAEIAKRLLIIETGNLAKQAAGSALVRYGETVILATVTVAPEPKEGESFFPLTVDYRERTYAAGKIPGGFFKREGRPRENEVVTSRLIDRPLRPLFDKNFLNEIQVMITVLSSDQENDADVPSIIGASCAVSLSAVPFAGPIGAVRVGRIGEKFIINPTFAQLEESSLDLVVAGNRNTVTMLEGGGREVPEEVLQEAIKLAHKVIIEVVDLEEKLIKQFAKPKMELPGKEEPPKNEELEKEFYRRLPYAERKAITVNLELSVRVIEFCQGKVEEALRISDKLEREKRINEIASGVIDKFSQDYPEQEKTITDTIGQVERNYLRRLALEENKRIDGRKIDEVRPISCAVGVLPRTHGSGLFTRGQTQALVTTTLGTSQDMQVMDELEREYKKRFMLHYNFPPFSTGEVRPARGPGRREIGHGVLAETALSPVLPREEEFPYTIRIVSDILESNGSSSMASVCGGTLSLMDAGVPITAPVAGVAMGLVKEGERAVLLTDIIGMEDFLGDMDFKVAGSRKGITAIQLDVKTDQITPEIMAKALEQSRKARLFILEKMQEKIEAPRKEISSLAPKILIVEINPDKIREVIGPGGKIVNKIQNETGAKLDIGHDGVIVITADTREAANAAKEMVEYLTADVEVGKIYKGKVTRIKDFGAFVEVLPGKEGLVHISQLADRRINKVSDVVKEGQEILVKCMEIDHEGRINLSRKAVLKEKQFPGRKREKDIK
ncbi:polyribonucleotide nucleotidyltransferase [bacterium]|nr:polyribonucleotide nucleotidyltransferase [bacterium]NIN93042.1 polyribonucleotide nucleotidyltransferase [bacterium]NIO18911.1 polyribonucleotide nucleotidyltransferase [bacterium]NIO73992.1 polyribonucleotide nucleotidyltransferase [bacterium]